MVLVLKLFYKLKDIKLYIIILKSITTAILFSSFIYLDYFDISNKFIITIFALFSYYLLLTIDKKELFLSGFLISFLWFWWVGYSFLYYDLGYLIPLVLVAIGFIYGGLFYLVGIYNNTYTKAIGFFILSFIYPFGFNYFQLELPFVNSFLGTSKIDFALILLSIVLIIKLQNFKKYIAILPLIFALNLQNIPITPPDIKIKLAKTDIPQDKKWDKNYQTKIKKENFRLIDDAIKQNYDLVILPETTFPLLLNKDKVLLQKLKNKSKKISIILGSLHKKDNNYHNSTYFFDNKKLQIAHKIVLIPFGEAVPLPEILKNIINNTFYNGAKDYKPALKPTDFSIKNIKFRNAICYEATSDKIYKNLQDRYIIAISNNAWFVPSIQPTLQNLLLKYYAKKYNVKIFSATNMGINKVID
jgi:apolipoprotein N-acyltransferase